MFRAIRDLEEEKSMKHFQILDKEIAVTYCNRVYKPITRPSRKRAKEVPYLEHKVGL